MTGSAVQYLHLVAASLSIMPFMKATGVAIVIRLIHACGGPRKVLIRLAVEATRRKRQATMHGIDLLYKEAGKQGGVCWGYNGSDSRKQAEVLRLGGSLGLAITAKLSTAQPAAAVQQCRATHVSRPWSEDKVARHAGMKSARAALEQMPMPRAQHCSSGLSPLIVDET